MLTVASVAFPHGIVGPDAVGGSEHVLAAIDAELVRRGHRSIVIAREGSRVNGRLVPLRAPGPVLDDAAWRASHDALRAALRAVLQSEDVDVVHLHGIDFHAYLPESPVAVLATLHLPPAWYPPAVYRLSRPRTFLNCVSRAQHADCPGSPLLQPPIPNGVRLDAFGARISRRRFVLALGRICAEKGFHLAIDAARAARMPFVLAGEVFQYPEHHAYFEGEIRPRLGNGVVWLRSVRGARKRRLLAAARCVVVSSTVPETSSLVAMEALASGTPVVAFQPLPGLLEHGRTGFLVRDVEDMARAFDACLAIDPAACLAVARERCDERAMTRAYIERYAALAADVA